MMTRWLELKSRPLPDGAGRYIIAIADELLEHARDLTDDANIVEASIIGVEGSTGALVELPVFSRLRALSLSGFGDADAEPLAAARLPALRTLELPDGALSAAGMRDLATAAWLPGLSRLRVYGHPSIDDDAIAPIAGVDLPNLTELNLRDCNIGPGGAAALAGASLPALRELELGNWYRWWEYGGSRRNLIGPDGARAIAGAAWIGQIEILRLSHNEIGDDGAEALAAALTAATDVDLNYNSIGPRGAKALDAASWARNARVGLVHNLLGHETDTFDTGYGLEPRKLTAAEIKSRYGFRDLY